MTTVTFRDSQQAFKEAISAGRLSTDSNADNFAGLYMYMGDVMTPRVVLKDGRTIRMPESQFKHINTRTYL